MAREQRGAPATVARRARAAERAVWIVDDDRSIRWVLEKALAREGIAHQTFSSAYEVLQALAVSEPHVLVSDIRMPGESGLRAARRGQGALSRRCRSSS